MKNISTRTSLGVAAAAIGLITLVVASGRYAADVSSASVAAAAVCLSIARFLYRSALLASMVDRQTYEARTAVGGASAAFSRGSANGAIVRGAIADQARAALAIGAATAAATVVASTRVTAQIAIVATTIIIERARLTVGIAAWGRICRDVWGVVDHEGQECEQQ